MAQTNGRVLLATVKGDVHDIGKNIVGVVLQCNNYEVIDLGVMVPAREDPRDGAPRGRGHHRAERAHHPVARGDGLRGRRDGARGVPHPAAHRRRHDLAGPHRRQDRAATTTGPTVHVLDASRAVGVAGSLLSDTLRDGFVADVREEYATCASSGAGAGPRSGGSRIADARRNRLAIDWTGAAPPVPCSTGLTVLDDYPLDDLVPRIDWTPFFQTWELPGHYPAILTDPTVGARGDQPLPGRAGPARPRSCASACCGPAACSACSAPTRSATTSSSTPTRTAPSSSR